MYREFRESCTVHNSVLAVRSTTMHCTVDNSALYRYNIRHFTGINSALYTGDDSAQYSTEQYNLLGCHQKVNHTEHVLHLGRVC